MSLHEIGEFGLIERLRRSSRTFDGVVLGIGDDCAALEVPAGELLLVTSDLLLENVHFRLDWTDLADLGAKAVAVNLSDIAAMGGKARHLVLGLGLPASMTLAEVDRLLDGFLAEAAACGVSLVGGDTCRAEQFLSIAVTAHGTVPADELVRRRGAKPGDLLYVSGTLGESGLALRQLELGMNPEPELARRHFRPQARLALGRALARAGLATAMIDISDGLLADLGHLLAPDALGAELFRAEIPFCPAFDRVAGENPELRELQLHGGEDYELLFSVDPARHSDVAALAIESGTRLTGIGRVTAPGEKVVIRDRDGGTVRPGPGGFRHF